MRRYITCLFIVLAIIFVTTSVAWARSGAYALSRWTVGGSVIRGIGGSYSLNGILGQADMGPEMVGGNYVLSGGFWNAGSVEENHCVYLPIVLGSR
jgi:hypothetical protein